MHAMPAAPSPTGPHLLPDPAANPDDVFGVIVFGSLSAWRPIAGGRRPSVLEPVAACLARVDTAKIVGDVLSGGA
jgi:hypothetical protein